MREQPSAQRQPFPDAPRRSLFATKAAPVAAGVHRKLWRKQDDNEIATALARAGASRRLTAELFMAGRVALAVVGFIAGFLIAHGAGRDLARARVQGRGHPVSGLLLSKAATRRAERIDQELPHFVDQLALVIEAGMSFDAAVTYLADVSEGPLGEEMKRVLTELRVGESRRAAIRNFALRVGSDNAMAFANAVLASDQLGSPLGSILRSQASDLRHRRQIYAEERAQKAPVKMLAADGDLHPAGDVRPDSRPSISRIPWRPLTPPGGPATGGVPEQRHNPA